MSEHPSRVGIVTGAASGIGLGIAERLARDGIKVALFDLNARRRAIRGRADPRRGTPGDRGRGRRRRPGRGRARRRRGAGELGAGHRPREQRRQGGLPAVPRHHSRGVRAVAPDQPGRHLPLLPGGPPRHDRGRLGTDREHLVVEHSQRSAADGPLRRVQVGDDRTDQVPRARVRAFGHHGQHHPAGLHRHADDPPQRRARPSRAPVA